MRNAFVYILTLGLMMSLATATRGVQVQDLVRIKGAETSKLVGMGLVIGLNGTGDGNKSVSTMRRLAAMMNRLGDPVVTAAELKDAKNVAVVYITATLPGAGVREGDRVDLQVSAPTASSLAGGQLVLTPMLGPVPGSPVYAFASGQVQIEDANNTRTGVIPGGATLTRDVFARYIDELGRMTLVIEPANATWPMANTLTTLVNDDVAPDAPPIAFALDQKNIVIQIPDNERPNPAAFISRVLEIQLDPKLVRTEARVVINQRTGTIVMTDDVQISPVVISHKGLTITTITPQPTPSLDVPNVQEQSFVGLDPSGAGGARLADLLNAFNQLKVPAEDRIAILKEIHRSGKLHAQLILED
ncbi:flagellar basal body P-ring protein FlgI [Planctomycetales bacterium ZRK34]|nr:flagellar basal body P-ring protein FlgI [Planctomycetales bacterium ZRK34]